VSKPVSPPPRCPHGRTAPVVTDDDGWHTPVAPEQCLPCRRRQWKGPRFKLYGVPNVVLARRVVMVECSEPGCCILVEPGKDHETPHLDPDVMARGDGDGSTVYEEPISVEIDHSTCWHAPREWNSATGYYVVSYCGKRGRPTDQSNLDDLVDCRTCLKRRP